MRRVVRRTEDAFEDALRGRVWGGHGWECSAVQCSGCAQVGCDVWWLNTGLPVAFSAHGDAQGGARCCLSLSASLCLLLCCCPRAALPPSLSPSPSPSTSPISVRPARPGRPLLNARAAMRRLSLSLAALVCAWSGTAAAGDIITSLRIKVQLFAAPAFFSEVSVDAYNNLCLSLDNNLYLAPLRSALAMPACPHVQY
jgi:hypothetical protein